MSKNKITFIDVPVEDFINEEYRDYSLYTLYERAIPSMIDSFKPSQRKIVYTALREGKDLKKTASLAGTVVSVANYHHGSTSLEDTIVTLTKSTNNIPVMTGQGYFGNRVVPRAASARYTQSRIGPNFSKYYLDSEICPANDDEDKPEPKFYLPIIPTVLANSVHGVAVGYASTINQRDPVLLAKLCAAHLMGKDISKVDIPPYFNDFNGTISKTTNSDGCSIWKSTGVVKHLKNNVYEITELPVGVRGKDRIEFKKLLIQLEKSGGISEYKDKCNKTGFKFEITLRKKCPSVNEITNKLKNEIKQKWEKQKTKPKNVEKALERELKTMLNKRVKLLTELSVSKRKPDEVIKSIIANFSLEENLNDNLTVTDENGDLRVFDDVNSLVVHFTNYRLSMYTARYNYRIDRDTRKLKIEKTKYGFINAIINDKIVLKGKSKKEIVEMLMKLGIERDLVDILISLPLHTICNDELAKLKQSCTDLNSDIERWKNADIKREYLSDLKTLIK